MPSFLRALGKTAEITVLSLAIATVLGVIFCLFKLSKFKVLQFLANLYISIIRGTPLIVQILFIFFGVPMAVKGISGNDFRWNMVAVCTVIMSSTESISRTEAEQSSPSR